MSEEEVSVLEEFHIPNQIKSQHKLVDLDNVEQA